VSTHVPALLDRLVDDAAVFPPGNAPLPDAVVAHRGHRAAWYADMVGPLLVPASGLGALSTLLTDGERLLVGVVGDTGIEGLDPALDAADERVGVAQVEVAVAKRGEDPQPGLRALLALLRARPGVQGYAETPLTWGLLAALDTVAEARAGGVRIAPKFRTGGLAAELFPTPVELAAVICACRDRGLPFKLTAGLHHAVRHTDPETGFTHHGFLNVLVATARAAEGAEVSDVAETLAAVDPVPLIEAGRSRRDRSRPLWIGFGSCSVLEPLTDLIRLGLVNGGCQ
jgi:hypothetical protein